MLAGEREKNVANNEWLYLLVTYHDIKPNENRPSPYKGEPSEYNQVSGMTISKNLYDALVAESQKNHKKFQVKNT